MQARPPHDAPTLTQWRVVTILCLVNAIAFIDRTVAAADAADQARPRMPVQFRLSLLNR